MDELQKLYDRDDFKEVWLRVATDIKIRTYENLNDLPEVQNLSSKVQQQIHSAANRVQFNYETIIDEGMFYNTAYVVLFDQNKENWMGMYQYNYATTLSKGLAVALGLGVCVGGVYYFCAAAPQHVSTLIGFISSNYASLQNWIIRVAGTIFSIATYKAFLNWLTNEHSEWKMLVAACILKKIQNTRGY
ncbi:unnamed protein product [Adineta steineri]|uniref:Uncharacterized protein n=1 Tax=Adineta steineri TaxID=433720 RepID=A0A815LY34_9BILA|nr:unnamed protein product [Adineta steineri]CAF1414813.1 unnamed protein product [Adineta steineri]CAF3592120.1 unnamed protein product [Adineta steineri]CAF3605123.1 unnamed protein product [Adineta steineri]